MQNFRSGGKIEGTIGDMGESGAMPPVQPMRPAAVPKHYVFDPAQGIWCPPSAVTATAAAPAEPDILVLKSDTQFNDDPNEPICFEYINQGVCSRLYRGGKCKHRHLMPMHPAVVEDRVKSGKLPEEALVAAKAGDEATLVRYMWAAVESRMIPSLGLPPKPAAPAPKPMSVPSSNPMDPGPEFQFCFDYTTKGVCKRMNNGIQCRARHLPKDHPDVIEYLKKPIPASTSGLRFKTKEEKARRAAAHRALSRLAEPHPAPPRSCATMPAHAGSLCARLCGFTLAMATLARAGQGGARGLGGQGDGEDAGHDAGAAARRCRRHGRQRRLWLGVQ